jgi:ABC-type Fe3+-hydroxamate transport system substrate-binding protein
MFVDAIGTSHNIAENPRILCLVPSITELLFDLDLDDYIVGRTAFCIHPKDRVKKAKSIGGTKQVNMDKVKALGATHLIVNIDENPKELVEELSEFIPHIIVTHPNKPSDNINLFSLLGGIFNAKGHAARLMSELQASIAHAQMATQSIDAKKVLYFIWKDPWMSISPETYISHSLSLVGLKTLPESNDVRYPEITLSGDLLNSADAILFSSEPFLFKEEHLDHFAKEHNVSRDKLHIIDGEMTSWYGSRAIAGMRYLADFAEKL